MTEESIDYLADIAERDQHDAELEGISRAVARHFTLLRDAGMHSSQAVDLCHGFQHDLMGGDGASIVMVGGEDE